MAEDYVQLAQGEMPNGASGVLYTAPALSQAIVKHIILADRGLAAEVTIWTTGATDDDLVLPPTTLEPGGHGDFTGSITLDAGETIEGLASADDAVTYSIFGVVLT